MAGCSPTLCWQCEIELLKTKQNGIPPPAFVDKAREKQRKRATSLVIDVEVRAILFDFDEDKFGPVEWRVG